MKTLRVVLMSAVILMVLAVPTFANFLKFEGGYGGNQRQAFNYSRIQTFTYIDVSDESGHYGVGIRIYRPMDNPGRDYSLPTVHDFGYGRNDIRTNGYYVGLHYSFGMKGYQKTVNFFPGVKFRLGFQKFTTYFKNHYWLNGEPSDWLTKNYSVIFGGDLTIFSVKNNLKVSMTIDSGPDGGTSKMFVAKEGSTTGERELKTKHSSMSLWDWLNSGFGLNISFAF